MSRRQIAGSALASAGMVLVVVSNGHFCALRAAWARHAGALGGMLWMVYLLVIKTPGGRYPAIFITRKVSFSTDS